MSDYKKGYSTCHTLSMLMDYKKGYSTCHTLSMLMDKWKKAFADNLFEKATSVCHSKVFSLYYYHGP